MRGRRKTSLLLFLPNERYTVRMQKTVRSIEELDALARELLVDFFDSVGENRMSATLLTLSGELGAGKTTFTQAIARTLGVRESVTSPTFVILKVYALENQPFERLVHIDAYRLEGGRELLALGFDDLLADPNNLILIEWPEKVADALPKKRIGISFSILSETERGVEIVDQTVP